MNIAIDIDMDNKLGRIWNYDVNKEYKDNEY